MQNSGKRVILNTGILYGRMLLTVGVSLYTTRLILNVLGSTDFGIFNLIAGVIAMLAFLNNAMATATQRFLSFYQGKDDLVMQTKVFTNSLNLHIFIGVIIVILLEITGLFLFDGFLNIPVERIDAAKVVYQWMIVSVFFTVLTVPFTGTLVAHENMLWVAVAGIIEVLLKLGWALYLYIVDFDQLIVYAIGMAFVSFFGLLVYAIYCFRHYKECTFNDIFRSDIDLVKELSSFTGWNLFGALCGVGRTQGVAVVLNLFFGTVVNAAYGIAHQISSQLNFFSSTLLRAINPQIMKSEGAGDRQRMLRLSMTASKFGFFLFAIVAIPSIFEMSAILKLWLKSVPEYTVAFCQLILISTLINQLTIGLQSAIQATGKIKVYQIVVGSIILFNLPIAYLLLKLGYSAPTVMYSFIVIEVIACAFRIYFIKMTAGMSVREYVRRVFLKEAAPLIVLLMGSFITSVLLQDQLFVFTFIIVIPLSMVSIYIFGLDKNEKKMITEMYLKIIQKVQRKEVRNFQ